MSIARQLCLWADELRAIAGNGLQFSSNPYDRANYERILNLAVGMFARATNLPVEELAPVLAETLGQSTPLAVGDAIVINAGGEILLIQRADSGLWAAPGGAFEVGETAAEGACRECYEETGVRVEPLSLIGVYDSRIVGTRVNRHCYHFSFLCRPADGEQGTPLHPQETLDVGWFPEDALPALDRGHDFWVPVGFRFWRGETMQAYFDPMTPQSPK
jgi:8-oxo-dGTP pyrophosphatase MutT (NUDIX family)